MDIRQLILDRIVQRGENAHSLAKQAHQQHLQLPFRERNATSPIARRTLADFINGKSSINSDALGQLLDLLGLEILPNDPPAATNETPVAAPSVATSPQRRKPGQMPVIPKRSTSDEAKQREARQRFESAMASAWTPEERNRAIEAFKQATKKDAAEFDSAASVKPLD